MEALNKRPDVLAFVETIAKEREIQQYTITDIETNAKGEGYLGQIFIITIQDKSSGKELNLVVKAAFIDDAIRKFVPIQMCFLNEIYFYMHIEPEFRKLGEDFGISHSSFFPKCYMVLSENKQEMLCLENLKVNGFEVFDKMEILDEEHISFIFKTYGEFHGYTFALKHKKPEIYGRLTSKLYNIYEDFIVNPDGKFTEFLRETCSYIESFLTPGEDDEIIKKFKKYSGEGLSECFLRIVTENCDYSTILHGDCWSNNMMFKYDISENCKKLVDMRLIDLQLAKIGSPACDLAYVLYSGCSKDICDKLDQYLKIYYESLSTTLKNFGCDPNKVFPFSALKEHWKNYAMFGMIMAFAILQVKTIINKEEIMDLTDMVNLLDKDSSTVRDLQHANMDKGKYEGRVKELLHHLSEIDAL